MSYKKIVIMVNMQMKMLFAYKFDVISSFLSIIIPIVGLTLFWSNTPIEYIKGTSYNSENIILYYLLVMLIEFIMTSDIAFSIEEDVAFGRLNKYIMLPFSYCWVKLIEYFIHNIFSIIILIIISILLFISQQFSIISFLYFFGLIFIGMILNFYIMMSIGLLTVWIQKINGLIYFLDTFISLLSGAVIPISCYPSWLKWITWNPFALSVSLPVESIMFDNIQITYIIVLLLWVVFFYFLSRLIWKKAVKDYAAYGG